jgi:hypothetical protein
MGKEHIKGKKTNKERETKETNNKETKKIK